MHVAVNQEERQIIMDTTIKKNWVNDLRTNADRQAMGRLGSTDGTRCCLGVLCDQAVRAGVIPEPATDGEMSALHYGREGESRFTELPISVMEWAGLNSSNPVVELAGKRTTLIDCNDTERVQFSRIADLIEEQL